MQETAKKSEKVVKKEKPEPEDFTQYLVD